MMKMEVNFIMTNYCKRCGGKNNANFQIQLTQNRVIEVCTTCFEWARDKTPAEINKDYKERSRRKLK